MDTKRIETSDIKGPTPESVTRLQAEIFAQHKPEMSATTTPNDESLIAAIEGNFEKMSHRDLVLTCKMLTGGRAAWRQEAEKAQSELTAKTAELEEVRHKLQDALVSINSCREYIWAEDGISLLVEIQNYKREIRAATLEEVSSGVREAGLERYANFLLELAASVREGMG